MLEKYDITRRLEARWLSTSSVASLSMSQVQTFMENQWTSWTRNQHISGELSCKTTGWGSKSCQPSLSCEVGETKSSVSAWTRIVMYCFYCESFVDFENQINPTSEHLLLHVLKNNFPLSLSLIVLNTPKQPHFTAYILWLILMYPLHWMHYESIESVGSLGH